MFGHHDVPVDAKAEGAAHALKGVLKDLPTRVRREHETETTEGYEMASSGVVITIRAPRYEVMKLAGHPHSSKRGLEWDTVRTCKRKDVAPGYWIGHKFTLMQPHNNVTLVLVLANITPVRFAT